MDEMPNHRTIIITGIIGIAAAILVGTGEFMLHFSPAGDYADECPQTETGFPTCYISLMMSMTVLVAFLIKKRIAMRLVK